MRDCSANIVCVSNESFLSEEARLINALFSARLSIFHLRKPNASLMEMKELMDGVHPEYRSKIALHSHHDLAEEFGVNRLHITEAHGPNFKRKEGFIYSTSFHDLESAKREGEAFDYYFLSPIFDSISKKGYKGKQMKSLSINAVALGGISLENLGKVKELGYESIAVLGAIWQQPQNALKRFNEIKEKWEKN